MLASSEFALRPLVMLPSINIKSPRPFQRCSFPLLQNPPPSPKTTHTATHQRQYMRPNTKDKTCDIVSECKNEQICRRTPVEFASYPGHYHLVIFSILNSSP